MTSLKTFAHCFRVAALIIVLVAITGVLRAETTASGQLPSCVTADGKPLNFVGPRRIIMRCAEMESGCKVTYKITLDDLGLAMDATVYSLEPRDPQLEPYWSRPGRVFIGKEFMAGTTHCLWHYEVKGSKER